MAKMLWGNFLDCKLIIIAYVGVNPFTPWSLIRVTVFSQKLRKLLHGNTSANSQLILMVLQGIFLIGLKKYTINIIKIDKEMTKL